MRASLKSVSSGFSLVELMIAMVLGLILVAGVIQVFIGNRQIQVTEQAVARVQEAGRLALEFVSEDLRLAGFSGTGGVSNEIVLPSVTNFASGLDKDGHSVNQYDDLPGKAIRVYSRSATKVWSPSAPDADIAAAAASDARAGSDLVVVMYAEETSAKISAGTVITGTDNVSIVPNGTCFENGELALLSSRAGAVIFKITNAPACGAAASATLEHAATGNSSDSFGYLSFDQFSRVMKLQHHVYYVADTSRKNAEKNTVWSLYRSVNGNVPEELVEGVEFLKLQYGERFSSGNTRYGDAGVVSVAGITSARVGVLVQGLDIVRTDDDARSYDLPGITIDHDGLDIDHGGGKTLRRVFATNVELRNRAQ